jgi:hypothetical protein
MTTRSIIRRIVPAIALLVALIAPAVHAVGLNLVPMYPDLTTFGATMTNTWTPATYNCFRSNGNPVDCSSPLVDPAQTVLVQPASGVFTIAGTSMALNPDGSTLLPVSGGSYNLTANFDNSGIFTGGTLLATGTTSDPAWQSGTIIDADLTNFGFSGSGSAGVFEFEFNDPFMTGDMAAFWGGYSGVIATTFNMSPTFTGDWDPSLDNNPAFWQRSFSATGNVDTFVPVPVPAAIWLFGSGLVGLMGFARRRYTRGVA